MAGGVSGPNGHLAMPSVEKVFKTEQGLVWNPNTEEKTAKDIPKRLKNVEREPNAEVQCY
jgi:hypothetical protein